MLAQKGSTSARAMWPMHLLRQPYETTGQPNNLDLEVKFGEILLRPVERTVASGPEGDGAGLCSMPSWPIMAFSALLGDV